MNKWEEIWYIIIIILNWYFLFKIYIVNLRYKYSYFIYQNLNFLSKTCFIIVRKYDVNFEHFVRNFSVPKN